MFERGWHKIKDNHSSSIAMQSLYLSGDLNLYGLYMLLYDVTMQSNGEISSKDFKFYCKHRAKLEDSKSDEFIACCIEHEVLTVSDDGNMYYLPEVQACLRDAEEARQRRLQNSSLGGQHSALRRAEASNQDNNNVPNSSMQASMQRQNYWPNIGH